LKLLNHRYLSSPRGMTLIEVLIVILLIALASAIAYPPIKSTLSKYNFRAAAREVLNATHQARSNALRDNRTWRVTFDPGTNSFSLDDFDRGVTAWTNNLASLGNGIRLIGAAETTCGNATFNWNNASISQAGFFSLTGRGFGNNASVFLEDANESTCFAITVRSNGSVKLRRYSGKSPFDVNAWK